MKNYFHGGNYATPHAQFYKNTAIKGEKMRAPDFDKLDILTEVLPKAKKRGNESSLFCAGWFQLSCLTFHL